MTIFVIIPTTADTAKLADAITAKLGPNAYLLPRGEWLASYEGTSQDLSNVLGISEGTNGTGLVMSISGYYGRAPTAIWEWIKARWK